MEWVRKVKGNCTFRTTLGIWFSPVDIAAPWYGIGSLLWNRNTDHAVDTLCEYRDDVRDWGDKPPGKRGFEELSPTLSHIPPKMFDEFPSCMAQETMKPSRRSLKTIADILAPCINRETKIKIESLLGKRPWPLPQVSAGILGGCPWLEANQRQTTLITTAMQPWISAVPGQTKILSCFLYPQQKKYWSSF